MIDGEVSVLRVIQSFLVSKKMLCVDCLVAKIKNNTARQQAAMRFWKKEWNVLTPRCLLMCFYKICVLLLSNNIIKVLLDLHFLLKNKSNTEMIIFIVDNYIFSNCFIVFLLELIHKPINMKLSACTIFILLYNI